MKNYYISNIKKDLKRKKRKKIFVKTTAKLMILFILLGILGHLINKNSDFLKDMYSTYNLIQNCQDLEKYQDRYESKAEETTKNNCAVIGVNLK